MYCCVLAKSYGQEPVSCHVDHQVSCWELYQALPPGDPGYIPQTELKEYFDPNAPVNWPQDLSCIRSLCVGPATDRKCEKGAFFFPEFLPGADYWQMAKPALVGERGYIGLEPPYQGETPCAMIWKCSCEPNGFFCNTMPPVPWIPVETEADYDSERCDGTGVEIE